MTNITTEMPIAIEFETPIIDCDSHLSEPADLWTSRLPRALQSVAPRVETDDAGVEWWWRRRRGFA